MMITAVAIQTRQTKALGFSRIIFKVARYIFSGLISTKFERKLRRQKRRFGKIATTVVLDKDKKFVMIRVATTSELSQQRNDAITYFTCSSISRHWELFFQNRSRELFPPIAASMFVKFKRNLFSLRFSVADQRPHTVQREDFYAIEICLVTACITSLRFFFTTKPRPKTALS